MCGIIGFVGNGEAAPVVLSALKKLEYRGYDSAGLAASDNGSSAISLRKGVGQLEEVEKKFGLGSLKGRVGIGHVRWATHGGVTDDNAHPHLDCNGEVAIVHNGIVKNFRELRSSLEAKGHRFARREITGLSSLAGSVSFVHVAPYRPR